MRSLALITSKETAEQAKTAATQNANQIGILSGNITTVKATADFAKMAADNVGARVENIVANSGDSNTEIVDVRQGTEGNTFTTLREHTKAIHKKIDKLNTKNGIVIVKECGAKGNGTNDDSKAIEDALKYAFDNNLAVYFFPGNYLVTRQVDIPIEVGAGQNGGKHNDFAIYGVRTSSKIISQLTTGYISHAKSIENNNRV